MLSRSIKRNLSFWGFTLLLCLLSVVLALMLSRFFGAFYSDIPIGYEPKDMPREQHLKQKERR